MRKILIIDGDYEFSRMVIPFLENLKFEVAGANNLQEARSEIERFDPDLILLSRELIGESGNLIPDGLGLLKEIKTHPRWKKIPVIFLVSKATEDDLEKLRRLKPKADDYASKPLEDNDLLRRIENLIGFDPEETGSIVQDALTKISQSEKIPENKTQTKLQAIADKEFQELFQHLTENLSSQEQVIDFAPDLEELSREQLKSELEFIQLQVRQKEKQDRELHAKWKKAIQLLKEKIAWLEQENQALRTQIEHRNKNYQMIIALLNFGRELLREMEALKIKLEKEIKTLDNFLQELENLKQKPSP